MSDTPWLRMGVTDENLEHLKREESKNRGKLNRFWMRKGESKKVILLDDEPAMIMEHTLKLGPKVFKQFTCIKGLDPKNPRCPLCDSRVDAYGVGYITILDATGYEIKSGKRKGETVLYGRQLFPMKQSSLKRFKARKLDRTSLVGQVMRVARMGENAPTVGDDWEFIDKVDPFEDKAFWFHSVLEGKDLPPEPFNYAEVLKPLSSEDLRSYLEDQKRGTYDDEGYERGNTQGGDKDTLY